MAGPGTGVREVIPNEFVDESGTPNENAGLIDPAYFPQLKTEPLYNAANNLRKMGSAVKEGGEAVNSAWRGLQAPGCYEAPEQDKVYSLQQPTVKDTADMHDDLFAAARLIGALANDYKAIQPDLTALASEAGDFRLKALQGWPERDDYPTSGYVGEGAWGTTDTDTKLVPWYLSNTAREANSQYVERLKRIKKRIVDAETTCADGLRMIDPVTGPPSDAGKYANLRDDRGGSLPDDYAAAAGPWGAHTGAENPDCASQAYYGLFKHPFDQALDGVASLAVGYDPATGQCSDATRSKAWENMASTSIAMVITALLGSDTDFSGLPWGLGQWIHDHQVLGAATFDDMVGYDPDPQPGKGHWHAWDEDFWGTAGHAIWTVGGTALAVAGPLAGVAGAFGVSTIAGLAELGLATVDFATLGAVTLARVGFAGLKNIVLRGAGTAGLLGDLGLLVDRSGRASLDLGAETPQIRAITVEGRVLSLKDFAREIKSGAPGSYTIVLEDGRAAVLTIEEGGASHITVNERASIALGSGAPEAHTAPGATSPEPQPARVPALSADAWREVPMERLGAQSLTTHVDFTLPDPRPEGVWPLAEVIATERPRGWGGLDMRSGEIYYDHGWINGQHPNIWAEPPGGTYGRGIHAEDLDQAYLLQREYAEQLRGNDATVYRLKEGSTAVDYVLGPDGSSPRVVSVKSLDLSAKSYVHNPDAVASQLDGYCKKLEQWYAKTDGKVALTSGTRDFNLRNPGLELDFVVPMGDEISPELAAKLNAVQAAHQGVEIHVVRIPR